jgi:hypothetical protein
MANALDRFIVVAETLVEALAEDGEEARNEYRRAGHREALARTRWTEARKQLDALNRAVSYFDNLEV